MSAQRQSTIAIIVFATLPVLYLLSYAPMYRLVRGSDVANSTEFELVITEGSLGLAWVPAEWIIDKPVTQEPFLWWARFWDVDTQIMIDGLERNPSYVVQ
jgi:hypothetical protein